MLAFIASQPIAMFNNNKQVGPNVINYPTRWSLYCHLDVQQHQQMQQQVTV